jgi:hypothetical protein
MPKAAPMPSLLHTAPYWQSGASSVACKQVCVAVVDPSVRHLRYSSRSANVSTLESTLPYSVVMMVSHSDASLSAFVAEYTAKDLILYALAIGFGSSDKHEKDELQFLYENHPHFSAVPTFPLVLIF